MRSKNVLISGANGYIARHLAYMLKLQGNTVVTASRGLDCDLQMDFSHPSVVAGISRSGLDIMIHTVSPNEALFKEDPYRALTEGSAGIHAALDFCKSNGIRDFIYISSFHVFGSSQGRLVEDTAVAPRNDYGLVHFMAEQTVQMFDRTGQVNGWIVRPSNLFGVPLSMESFTRWNLIPFAFCKEAVESGTITLSTPGGQLRNFIGVSDVCNKILWIMDNQPDVRILHAYGKTTMSVLQFASLVKNVAQSAFNLPVAISYPLGHEPVTHFEFNSHYQDDDLRPQDELERFVETMLEVLLSRKL